MDTRIQDSSGAGYGAKVDSDKRLHVDSVQRSQSQQAILKGNGFNISTGSITLTSANQSALIYIKNDSDNPLVVKEIGVRAGASTIGIGSALIQLYANGDAGTIISGATDASTNFNRNLGSAKPLVGDVFKGSEGNTLTGGISAGVTATDNFTEPIIFDADIFVLPKGTSLGVLYTPPAGNTSQNVVVFSTVFYETTEINGN